MHAKWKLWVFWGGMWTLVVLAAIVLAVELNVQAISTQNPLPSQKASGVVKMIKTYPIFGQRDWARPLKITKVADIEIEGRLIKVIFDKEVPEGLVEGATYEFLKRRPRVDDEYEYLLNWSKKDDED